MTCAIIIEGPKDFNPVQDFAELTPIHYLTYTFKRAGIHRIIRVGDAWAKEIEVKTRKLIGENLWRKRAKKEDISIALNALRTKFSRVLIAPANFPLCEVETVRLLTQSSAPIVAPMYSEKRGWPICIDADLLADVTEVGSIHEYIEAHADEIVLIDVDDVAVVTDIAQEAAREYALEILKYHSQNRHLHFGTKLTIKHSRDIFGPGIYQYLRLVQESASVESACKAMGIARHHMANRVANFEKRFGITAVTDRKSVV